MKTLYQYDFIGALGPTSCVTEENVLCHSGKCVGTDFTLIPYYCTFTFLVYSVWKQYWTPLFTYVYLRWCCALSSSGHSAQIHVDSSGDYIGMHYCHGGVKIKLNIKATCNISFSQIFGHIVSIMYCIYNLYFPGRCHRGDKEPYDEHACDDVMSMLMKIDRRC